MTRTLRFILGDQLSPALSALKDADPARDVIAMAEVHDETVYAPHHKKKIAFLFAAMRAFAREREAEGFRVDYQRLDAPEAALSLSEAAERAALRAGAERIVTTEAAEWRVRASQAQWGAHLGLVTEVRADNRFLCTEAEFRDWAADRKQLRMEFFYREMRRRYGLLMEGDEPAGGRWNFDSDNRKPAKPDLFMPEPPRFAPDGETRAVLDLVATRFASHFGDLEPFWFAVTRRDANTAADWFFAEALPRFGDYQDAMLRGAKFLYHSVLSPYLNAGLLEPLDLCQRAEAAWRAGLAPLNAVEGFIRQILGWREYVRGIYWLTMPGYTERNALGAERPLPAFYWTGETDMTCMATVIGQTREEAYAHHIQRLMVTGNFALLAGFSPAQVHEWYLAVYADAYEWVEAPNTIGMSLFADGGLLGSKPYAASGAYIDRMSDYCGQCRYDVDAKTGPDACPFNYLYWDFIARHRQRLAGNPRLAQVYRTYDRLSEERREAIAVSAATFLARLDTNGTDRDAPSVWDAPYLQHRG